jgi:hypothetical protein
MFLCYPYWYNYQEVVMNSKNKVLRVTPIDKKAIAKIAAFYLVALVGLAIMDPTNLVTYLDMLHYGGVMFTFVFGVLVLPLLWWGLLVCSFPVTWILFKVCLFTLWTSRLEASLGVVPREVHEYTIPESIPLLVIGIVIVIIALIRKKHGISDSKYAIIVCKIK